MKKRSLCSALTRITLAAVLVWANAPSPSDGDSLTTDPTEKVKSATTIQHDGPPEVTPALQEGDDIEVVVFEDASFNGTYRIRQGGYVVLPQVGQFRASGLSPSQIETALKMRLEQDLLRKATVSVLATTAKQTITGVVYVIGEVKHPGVLQLPVNESLTILTAIIRAGGLNEHADPTKIQLARLKNGRREISFMHFDATLAGIESGAEMVLQDGDIVNIVGREGIDMQKAPPPSRGIVYFSGQVKTPGPHDIMDLTVYKTILRYGGFDRFANLKKVYVLRLDTKTGLQMKIPVNVQDIVKKGALDQDIPVQPGDIIVVPEKFFSF